MKYLEVEGTPKYGRDAFTPPFIYVASGQPRAYRGYLKFPVKAPAPRALVPISQIPETQTDNVRPHVMLPRIGYWDLGPDGTIYPPVPIYPNEELPVPAIPAPRVQRYQNTNVWGGNPMLNGIVIQQPPNNPKWTVC